MFTSREKEVIDLLMIGKTNMEIAKYLCITSHTVKAHIGHIYSKLDVHSRIEMAVKLLKEEMSNLKDK